MKKPKQLHLFKKDLRFFGGLLLLGRRKSKRPYNSKEAMHLVLRSSWAKGKNSFLHSQNKKAIENIIERTAKTYFIRVYQRAIVGNHLHLVIKAPKLKNYQTFIRVLSSQIASHVMKSQSFQDFQAHALAAMAAGDPPSQEPQGKEQQFWQMRPFSRILYWGRDFKTCCQYVTKNKLEALGFLPYQVRRKDRYAKWLKEYGPGDPPLSGESPSGCPRSKEKLKGGLR